MNDQNDTQTPRRPEPAGQRDKQGPPPFPRRQTDEFSNNRRQDVNELALRLPVGALLFGQYSLIKPRCCDSQSARWIARDEKTLENLGLTLVRYVTSLENVEAHPFHRAAERVRRLQRGDSVLRVLKICAGPFDGVQLIGVAHELDGPVVLRDWASNQSDEPRCPEPVDLFRGMALAVASLHAAGLVGLNLALENFTFLNGAIVFDALASFPPLRGNRGPEDESSDIRALGRSFQRIIQLLVEADRSPSTETTQDQRRPNLGHLRRVIDYCLAPDRRNQFHNVRAIADALADDSMGWDGPGLRKRDNRWRDIESMVALGKLNEADDACDALLEDWPHHKKARELQTQLRRRFLDTQRLYERIEREADSGTLSRTVDLLQRVVRLYPDHPAGAATQTRLASIASEFKSCMAAGLDSVLRGAWDSALHCFRRAHELDRGSPSVLSALAQVQEIVARIQSDRREIDEAVSRRDKESALSRARALDAFIDGVLNTMNETEGPCVN